MAITPENKEAAAAALGAQMSLDGNQAAHGKSANAAAPGNAGSAAQTKAPGAPPAAQPEQKQDPKTETKAPPAPPPEAPAPAQAAHEPKSANAAPPPEQEPPENTETRKGFSSALTRAVDFLLPAIEQQLEGHGINMTEYQRTCVLMGISAINALLDKEGLTLKSPKFDPRNLTEILLKLASLQLNAAAQPREVYFQTRNVKLADGEYKRQLEMGIEGDGNDAILRRFGADVKRVERFWSVRSEDKFVYPKRKGLDMTPPEWEETGRGNVVRIVYPIITKNNTIEFYISEREDVKKNLAAHINNNMMKETFGVAKDSYNATPEQKKEIAARKKALLAKVDGRLIEDIIDDPELQPWISPAWTEPHSRESMIIRKMRNNVVKKIPKDFSSAYVASQYNDLADDVPSAVEAEIAGSANREPVDVEYTEVPTDPNTGEVVGDAAPAAAGKSSRPKPY